MERSSFQHGLCLSSPSLIGLETVVNPAGPSGLAGRPKQVQLDQVDYTQPDPHPLSTLASLSPHDSTSPDSPSPARCPDCRSQPRPPLDTPPQPPLAVYG